MRPRSIVLPLFLALAAGTVFASASASRAAPAVASSAVHAQDEDTKLSELMEGIRADLKRLGKEIESKDQDTAWKTVCSLQKQLLDAKQESPAKAASMSESDRPAFVNEYRVKLVDLLKATCDLEAALLGGKFDEARKVFDEVIWPMQKPAHKKFRNG